MYHEVAFTVPAIPIAQPRPRAAMAGGHARVYGAAKDHPIHAFKAAVMHRANAEYDMAPHDGPVAISVLCVLPRPKHMFWKTKPMPRERHIGRPDADNIFKAVTDSLNGLVFTDDSRIYEATVVKAIAAGDEQPHCEVVIRLEDWTDPLLPESETESF
jgi:Holliday junction resolvase RusA-like endonuclease